MNIREATWDEWASVAAAASEAAASSRRKAEREAVIRKMVVDDGLSFAAVGARLGISRERVRQIMAKRHGLTAMDTRRPVICGRCGSAVNTSRWAEHNASGAHRAGIEQRAQARRVLAESAFWAKARPTPSGCWEWTGRRYPTGYGGVRLRHVPGGGGYAHRVAYILAKGPIPAGQQLDHLCRNPPCVNPAHLEAVTPRENVMRSPIAPAAINARKTHCLNGHEFTPENTYYANARGHRACRTCRTSYFRNRRREVAA